MKASKIKNFTVAKGQNALALDIESPQLVVLHPTANLRWSRIEMNKNE